MPGLGHVKYVVFSNDDGRDSVDIRSGKRAVIDSVVLGFMIKSRIGVDDAGSSVELVILNDRY